VANNVFYPRYSEIISITNDVQATVTFTEDHDFTPGEIVSFRIEKQFGMSELNNRHARVLFISSDSVVVNINTQFLTPFTLAQLNQPGTTPPVCIPSSSSVIPFEENAQVNLEDSFDNRRI
jgi:hypothetical protein